MRTLKHAASLALAAAALPACLAPHVARFDHTTQDEQKMHAGCPSSAADIEGNRYNTVLIGQQCWFAENLRVTRFHDGTSIPEDLLTSIDVAKYGRLYRWAAVASPSGICPAGWHVPSDQEFLQLELAIGMPPEEANKTGWRGSGDESRKLKQFDVARTWDAAARALVNQSGFSALPGGGSDGWVTTADGIYGDFWTRTEHDAERAWYRSLTWWSLHPDRERIRRVHIDKGTGTSVRCIHGALDSPNLKDNKG